MNIADILRGACILINSGEDIETVKEMIRDVKDLSNPNIWGYDDTYEGDKEVTMGYVAMHGKKMYMSKNPKKEVITIETLKKLIQLAVIQATFTPGADRIKFARQLDIKEGFDTDFNMLNHKEIDLALVASAYALGPLTRMQIGKETVPPIWPWNTGLYKPPTSRVEELVKAGKFLVAALDYAIEKEKEDLESNTPKMKKV